MADYRTKHNVMLSSELSEFWGMCRVESIVPMNIHRWQKSSNDHLKETSSGKKFNKTSSLPLLSGSPKTKRGSNRPVAFFPRLEPLREIRESFCEQ